MRRQISDLGRGLDYTSGFMLAELLIVIAVATVLLTAGLALLNPSKQINRGNDAKRKADLITLQSAMERYYADTGDYPGSIGWCAQISSSSYPEVKDALGNYLKKVPQDPKYAGTTNDYYYWHSALGEYRLYAVLEDLSGTDVVPNALSADGGIPGCTGANTNYNTRGGSYTALALAHTPTPVPPTNTPTPIPPTATPTPKSVLFDAKSDSGAEVTASIDSWSHTISGSNRLLMVGAVTENSTTVTAIWKPLSTNVGEALAYVPSSSPQGTSGDRVAYMLYRLNPTAGVGTIIATASGSNFKAGSISLREVNQSTPFGTPVVANVSSGTSVTTAAITSESTGMIVDVLALGNNSTLIPTPGASQTSIWTTIGGGTNPSGAGSYKTGQASTTMSWSWTSTKSNSIIAVPVKAAP